MRLYFFSDVTQYNSISKSCPFRPVTVSFITIKYQEVVTCLLLNGDRHQYPKICERTSELKINKWII